MPFRVVEIIWTTEGKQGKEVLSFIWGGIWKGFTEEVMFELCFKE